jgi:serralysin
MATYTHFEVANSPADAWANVMGTTYAATQSVIIFANIDGTKTKAQGVFLILNGNVVDGFVTSLQRTSADGQTFYESITGFASPVNPFLAQAADERIAYVLGGNDTLTGYSGDERLDGGAGADQMAGGKGQDVYYVDQSGDVVTEASDGGFDIVYVTGSDYTNPANIEQLIFISPGKHVGTGNDGKNTLIISEGYGTLYGLGGDDHFNAYGGGTNTLYGGLGDDVYSVHAGDTVIELPGEGLDTVVTGLSNFVLPANVEKLQVEFSFGPAYGNELDNTIHINGGAPQIYGLGGNDTLFGGYVGDILDGGEGNDRLVVGGGMEKLIGGNGDDTGVFKYNLQQCATVDLGESIVVITPGAGATLLSVEHLEFKDGTVHVNDGNGLFDTLYYMNSNLDVFHAGVDALAHYNAFGWHEARDPNFYFDTSGYLAVDQDVAASGMNPLEHYHQIGWHEGRDPGLYFDTTLYLIHNPDVAAAGVDPLEHYLQHGRAEGRQSYYAIGQSIVDSFDAQYYLFHSPDVVAAGADPLQHYLQSGWKEGRDPNAWFDSDGYLAHYADVATAGVNPLEHYMMFGWKEGRDPSAAFDTIGYIALNNDVAAAGVNPLDHYLQSGIYEGRQIVNDGLWH